VTGKYTDGTAFSDEFNTVVFAIGRDACTENIGLDKIGVKLNPQVESRRGILPCA
jgi:thioredoxin reductase (NADPH)